MQIKKYTYGRFKTKKSIMCIRFGDYFDFPYWLSDFLKEVYPYKTALLYKKYIKESDLLLKISIADDIHVILDKETYLVYIVNANSSDYNRIPGVTNEMVLKLCKQDEVEFDIVTFDNFKYLFRRWKNLLKNEPPFALLYQNQFDWYDVMRFQTRELMLMFIENHLEANVIDKNSMYIKKHSYYSFDKRKLVDFRNLELKDTPSKIPLCLESLLEDLYPYERGLVIKKYISESDDLFPPIGKLLRYDVILEHTTNLVYIVQGYNYDMQRSFEPKITKEEVIELCKNNNVRFDIVTFENFIYLIHAWLDLSQNHLKYVLLYQDESEWYDFIQFPTNRSIKKFVAKNFKQ